MTSITVFSNERKKSYTGTTPHIYIYAYIHVVLVYYLLKNTMLNTKSTTKMATNEMTTDAVVLSPTPLAPPIVVVPHPQEMTAITAPNATLLADMTPISLNSKYFAAESMTTFGETP